VSCQELSTQLQATLSRVASSEVHSAQCRGSQRPRLRQNQLSQGIIRRAVVISAGNISGVSQCRVPRRTAATPRALSQHKLAPALSATIWVAGSLVELVIPSFVPIRVRLLREAVNRQVRLVLAPRWVDHRSIAAQRCVLSWLLNQSQSIV
jgi:hypothetical protein